ncbi:TPA: LysR family transcriptional regulator [Burkholderia cepacia]|uniref:Probable RuBisCO transcriptional regulator n=1 Tax=Medicago truncatula TaxID=3880 RepID=A0A072TDT4_MEDTR|nr:LysR family transcriptional regulator [Burkholderia cepacia]KEH15567.1 LysR family transcriptional regulator [Medicago truncatula]MCA8360061.1 LysR family transcriptional regulator [Burkholderia cepacia]HDR9762269.1 LysR family transcriptional regulator [Burkholderia cepacia ATCC 25416]HDV6370265.1 LysR family transcriptional regulator [Burkholderia cepacia]
MDLLVSMEAFLRAAEADSFAGAARQLNVTRSVVTMRIQQLEEHLGVALFHRSTRITRLSEMGEVYYRECLELIGKVQDLRKKRPEPVVLSGSLRIHVLSGFALDHFSRTLINFRKTHPLIEFEVTVSDRVIDPVREGYDIALQAFPSKSDLLIERRLIPMDSVLCAASSYFDEQPAVNMPEDLIRHELAGYLCLSQSNKFQPARIDQQFEFLSDPVLATNSVHLLHEFARAGSGIACLPLIVVAKDLEEKRLMRVLPNFPMPKMWLSAVYPECHRSTPRVKTFVDFLHAQYTEHPHWQNALGFAPVASAKNEPETELVEV